MPTKSVAKKVAKKVTAAKKSTKKSAGKQLVHADSHTSFWVNDGQILNSLVALRDAFSKMPKDVYEYHSGTGQDDFANWVESVLMDAECADDLRKVKTSSAAKAVVVKHLKNYSL
jgi:hypothetical protein